MLLGGQSGEEFLQSYWQKKPRLIRDAWPGITSPISPEELAGLACEERVGSRLVSLNNNDYQLKEGPLSENDFKQLPVTQWSLLVTDIEKWLPELSFLLSPFDFLPAWRIDDLMISYATDGGGVGPHVDEYDVFLLQLSGQRQWQVGKNTDDKALRSDCDLAVLQNFQEDQSWGLEPGDMLYLPPGFPHQGIAIGDCMTASIGFRAPLVNTMAADYAGYLTEQEATRYHDSALEPVEHNHQLSPQALTRFKDQILELYSGDEHFAEWAGEFLTSTDEVEAVQNPLDRSTFLQHLDNGAKLIKNSWSKLLYHHNGTDLTLFADAVSYSIESVFLNQIQLICSSSEFALADLSSKEKTLIEMLYQLYLQGSLILEQTT